MNSARNEHHSIHCHRNVDYREYEHKAYRKKARHKGATGHKRNIFILRNSFLNKPHYYLRSANLKCIL